MKIIVDAGNGKLKLGNKDYDCVIGKHGYVAQNEGREGDGKTPLGTYALRYGLYRADRVDLPETDLPFYPVRQDDGWCDAPHDSAYNRPVRLPYRASAEALHKESHVYDVIIVLGHNDSPPIADMGSAIFMHIARGENKPTQGCVAVSLDDMMAIVPKLVRGMDVEIKAG